MGSCILCNFEGIDILEIKMKENSSGFLNLAGSNFEGTDFRGLDHEKFDFSGKIVGGCDSTTTIMASPAILTGSNFSGVDTKTLFL